MDIQNRRQCHDNVSLLHPELVPNLDILPCCWDAWLDHPKNRLAQRAFLAEIEINPAHAEDVITVLGRDAEVTYVA